MHLPLISKFVNAELLQEMAAVKLCPLCSKSMAANHYWYKGGWKCKGASKTLPVVPSVLAPSTTTPLIKSAVKAAHVHTTSILPAVGSSAHLTSYSAVENWLFSQKIKEYRIAADLSVSVQGSISLRDLRCNVLPVNFSSIAGDIWITDSLITSLIGLPSSTNGDLEIWSCGLTTLEGIPNIINGNIVLNGNRGLTSLDHFPTQVTGDINITSSPLTSLVGLPSTVNNSIHLKLMEELTSLEGMPSYVTGAATLEKFNALESLNGMGDIGNNFYILEAPSLESLKGMGKVGGNLSISGVNSLQSLEGMNSVGKSVHLYFTPDGKIKNLVGLVPGNGQFIISGNIGSFEGMPAEIKAGTLNMPSSGMFEHIPSAVHGDLILSRNYSDQPISLIGIHKHIKTVKGILRLELESSAGGLGILRIKNLEGVQVGSKVSKEMKQLSEILSKALDSRTDILEVQEQLIAAGLSKYARL